MNGITRNTTAYTIKYLTKAIPSSFPNAYMMPTTANSGKNIIHAVKLKIYLVMIPYVLHYSAATPGISAPIG
jgi:hypothetical protein